MPLAQVDLADNSIDYLHTDINGSVIALTNDTGHLDGITNYGAYGKQQGSAISRYGYAGEWTDPTTTYTYLRARWYDPNTGSFLSKDPLYELTQEAYGYANANPLLNIDPSGLMSFSPNFITDFASNANRQFEEKAYVIKNGISTTTSAITNGVKSGYQHTVNFVQRKGGEIGGFVNSKVTPKIDKAKEVAGKGVKWTLDNSGNISFVLMVGAVATANPITAPISAVLATGSIVSGSVAAGYDVVKCTGAIKDEQCDTTSLVLNTAGVATGGIGTMVGKGAGKLLEYTSHSVSSYSFARGSVLNRRAKNNSSSKQTEYVC